MTTIGQFKKIFETTSKDYKLSNLAPDWNTKGFMSFETEDSYVEITGVQITRGKEAQKKFSISNADSSYQKQVMNLSVSLAGNETILSLTNNQKPVLLICAWNI